MMGPCAQESRAGDPTTTMKPWTGRVLGEGVRVYRGGQVYNGPSWKARLGTLAGPLETGGWKAWSDYEAEPDAPFRTRREALEWLLSAYRWHRRSQQREEENEQ